MVAIIANEGFTHPVLSQIRYWKNIMKTAGDTGGYKSDNGFRDAFAYLFDESVVKNLSGTLVVLTRVLTPLGPLIAGATEEGLCLLEFAEHPQLKTRINRLCKEIHCVVTPGENAHIGRIQHELDEYFSGKRIDFNVPLIVPGTDFQRQVWEELQRIPYGETRSYEDIARAIDNPKAFRAVGRANGNNRIPIVIPCHRVVRADGTLGGYGGERWRKRFLLDLEGHPGFN